MDESFAWALDEPVPSKVEVGGGTALVVRGWTAGAPEEQAWRFLVELGEDRRIIPHSRDVRWDVPLEQARGRVASGFFLLIPIPSSVAGSTQRLRITLLGRTRRSLLVDSQIELVTRTARAEVAVPTRVAICLATYNPPPALFERQIESLRAQSFTDWTCLVQDDGSRPEALEAIERICSRDRRFVLLRADRNLGFYRNFERCLAQVPKTVEAVALCDQDDRWYPDKLAKGLERLRDPVQLVYSDMKLVDAGGRLISNTYWSERRNNYRSLETLILANTVTGAASVFRRSLLDVALPFPPFVDTIFHDHWLAVVAMLRGGIDYLDEALYDYTQHGTNVIGHAGFAAVSTAQALTDHATKLLGLLFRGRPIHKLLDILPIYYTEYRKMHLFAEVLGLRLSTLSGPERRVMARFSDRLRNAPQLMIGSHLGVLRRGDTTNMIEFHMGVALLVHRTLGRAVPSLLRLERALNASAR